MANPGFFCGCIWAIATKCGRLSTVQLCVIDACCSGIRGLPTPTTASPTRPPRIPLAFFASLLLALLLLHALRLLLKPALKRLCILLFLPPTLGGKVFFVQDLRKARRRLLRHLLEALSALLLLDLRKGQSGRRRECHGRRHALG